MSLASIKSVLKIKDLNPPDINTFYVAVGVELNIVLDALFQIEESDLSNYTVHIVNRTGNGSVANGRYTYTPTATGTHYVAIAIIIGGLIQQAKKLTIVAVSNTIGTGTKGCMLCGDSLTDRENGPTKNFYDKITAGGGITATALGLMGTAPYKDEGWGGKKMIFFANGTTYLGYEFVVTGVTVAPGVPGAYYSNNGNNFYLRESFNISGGNGTIKCENYGGNAPEASGTLTKGGGTGDAIINFTSRSQKALNPFWNENTSQVDFSNYMTERGYSACDYVFIQFGMNDMRLNTVATTGDLDTMMTHWKTFIDSILAYNANCKIMVSMTPLSANNMSSLTSLIGATQAPIFEQNLRLLWDRLILEFKDGAYDANVHLIPTGVTIDRTMATHDDAIHPNDTWLGKIGDYYYSYLRYLLT